MLNVALVVRIVAKPGKGEALASFLTAALPLAEAEAFTPVWLAYQADEHTFYITDCFADEEGRQAHINGEIAAALFAHADELLAAPPEIVPVNVLAAKLPA